MHAGVDRRVKQNDESLDHPPYSDRYTDGQTPLSCVCTVA